MITRSKAKTQALFEEVEWNRDVNHVRKLLSQGADVNAKNELMHTPLHMALNIFSYDTLCQLKSELAESGSSGKYAGESNVRKIIETRIKRAVDVVDLLLRHGANVNAKTSGGCTPLHLAPGIVNISEMLTYLPVIWPDIEWKEHIKKSLLKAAVHTAIRIVELLLSNGADVNGKDPNGSSSESVAECYMTPLHAAVVFGFASVLLELLLERQADVNARDEMGNTPLHVAHHSGQTELLLKHGADANARDGRGETPLFNALRIFQPSILELLLEHGANVNIETTSSRSKRTPLHYAASFLSTSVVKFLLEHGANVNPENPLIFSPLHCAVNRHSPSIAKLLLDYGADINAGDDEGKTPLHLLFEIHCLISFKDMLDLLLEHGADLEARDDYGRTPVFCIEYNIHHFPKGPKQLLAAIDEIFSHGVCHDAIDDYDETLYYPLTQNITIKPHEIKKSVLHHVKKLIMLDAIHLAKEKRPPFFDGVDPFKRFHTRLEPKYQANPLKGEGGDLYESCLNEVDVLETIQIFQNITLADVLTLGDPITIARISNNTVFQQYAQSVDLDSNFPNYAFVISHQYQRGLQMKLLCEKCEVSLGIVSSGKLHRYCAHEILKYLSAIDLKNLAEAGNR